MNVYKAVISAGAAGAWSLAGLAAGVVLGLTMGLPGRFLPLLAILGLAVGWFGLSGTYRRVNTEPAPKNVTLLTFENDTLKGEEARKWLDDFLLKQQKTK